MRKFCKLSNYTKMTDSKELVRRIDNRPENLPEVNSWEKLVGVVGANPYCKEQFKKWILTKVVEAKKNKNAPVWHESPVSRLVYTREANWRENK